MQAFETLEKFCDDNVDQTGIILSHPLNLGEYQEYEKYKWLTSSTFTLKTRRKGDSCCLLNDEDFLEISFFARSKTSGQLFIAGKKYLNSKPLYHEPGSSAHVGVYRCNRLDEEIKFYPVDENDEDALKKVYRIPIFGTKDFVCSTLLHGL